MKNHVALAECRKKVYELLANNPTIRLYPSDNGEWTIDVPAIALSFGETVSYEDWSQVLVQVQSAVAAYKAYAATVLEIESVPLLNDTVW